MNGIVKRSTRRVGLAAFTLALGATTLTAYADKVDDMRRALAAAKQEFFQLNSEIARVTTEMAPLEARIQELLVELENATHRRHYNAVLRELQVVGSEWSALRYEQINLQQEIEFVAGVIAELERAIAAAVEDDGFGTGVDSGTEPTRRVD